MGLQKRKSAKTLFDSEKEGKEMQIVRKGEVGKGENNSLRKTKSYMTFI